MSDAEFWKSVALYLADCHAATATHDGALKSTSKSRRERFASICAKALAFVERKDTPYTRGLDEEAQIVDRLRRAAKVGAS